MKNIACIIVRTNSQRLKKKALIEVQKDTTMIDYLIKKIKRSKLTDAIYLCTSTNKDDKILLEIAEQNEIKGYAGSEDKVIDRLIDVGNTENADNIIRITGDNIFSDEVYLDLMLKYHNDNNAEYTRTEYLPIGVTSEVINFNTLKNCKSVMPPEYSEYMFLYIFQPEIYKCQVLIPPLEHQKPEWTLTVDNKADFKRTMEIINGNEKPLYYHDIVEICKQKNISNLFMLPGNSVKFPANIRISFEAFCVEKNNRIKQSSQITIKNSDYQEVLKRIQHESI